MASEEGEAQQAPSAAQVSAKAPLRASSPLDSSAGSPEGEAVDRVGLREVRGVAEVQSSQ